MSTCPDCMHDTSAGVVYADGYRIFPFDFGHDRLGHRVANTLNRAHRFTGYGDVRAASDDELRALPGMGVIGLARVRQVLSQPCPPHGVSGDCGICRLQEATARARDAFLTPQGSR